jgi:hypothetical protein
MDIFRPARRHANVNEVEIHIPMQYSVAPLPMLTPRHRRLPGDLPSASASQKRQLPIPV